LLTTSFILIWVFFLKNTLLAERLFSSITQRDLAGREFRWEMAIDIFHGSPIFGVGETGYGNLVESMFGVYTSPHNVFVEILAYTGIIGLFLFLVFFCRVIGVAFRNFKDNNELLSLILLIPIFGLIISGQILGTKIVWLIFAYIISVNLHSNKKVKISNENYNVY